MPTETITTPSGFTATLRWKNHDEPDAHLLTTATDPSAVRLRLDGHPQRTGHYASVELDPETLARLLELVVEAWDDDLASGRPRELSPRKGWSILVMTRQRPYVVEDHHYVWVVWELAPWDEERPVDPPHQVTKAYRAGILALEARTGPMPVDLSDLGAIDQPCFDSRQRYGPLTPWVVSNVRAFVSCVRSDALVSRMLAVVGTQDWRTIGMVLHTLARDLRRERALEEASELARRLVEERQRRPSWWVDVRRNALDLRISQEESEHHLLGHLGSFVSTSVSALVLEDRLEDRQLLPSLGAWRTLLAVDECDTGPAWRCSPATVDRLVSLVQDWDEERLVTALEDLELRSDPVQQELRLQLIGSTMTRAASPPPPAEIVGVGLGEAVQFRGGRSMVDGLSRLVAALSEPPRWVGQRDVQEQRRVFSDLFGVSWR